MPLTADLTVRLDATSLVQSFLGDLTEPAGDLQAITVPSDPAEVATAAAAGGAFSAAPILAAVGRFADVSIASPALPLTLSRIDATLTSIESLTTRDTAADLAALAAQVTAELERGSAQGLPGTLLTIADLLRGSPGAQALGPLLGLFGGSLPSVPPGLTDYLPAFAQTVRVLAGLMVFETVLAEGDRLTGVVAGLFNAERARRQVESVQLALQFGALPLAQALAAADPADTGRVDALADAVENAGAQLDALVDYVARGMGFGEATLVHFDIPTAQVAIGTAGALLRDPDLGALRRTMQSLADVAQPLTTLLDPGAAGPRTLEQVLQLAESQADQAAAAIRALDASVFVEPLSDGIAALTSPLRDFTSVVARVVTEVRAALEQVRAAVVALPIDDLASAIRTALDPVTQALQLVQRLVDGLTAALDAAVGAALTALGEVEGGVDAFQAEMLALFAEAREFVDGLHLDQVVGSIADGVNEFVGLLQQAQLQPYFDTAASAIDTAADAIDQVPLELLPESMKADLDAALAPVREIDPDAVEQEIESLLQIGPDGEFQLRGDLEQALATIQARFEALIALLDEHHPRKYLAQLDAQLTDLAGRIQELSPQLTLEPVQQAITQVQDALGAFDLVAQLQPVQDVFDRIIGALDAYSPAQLLAPLQERVTAARVALTDALHLDDWRPTLDGLVARAVAQLDVLDPTALDALLQRLIGSLRDELGTLEVDVGRWLGTMLSGLMRGSGLRLDASSMAAVMDWLRGGSATQQLGERSTRIAAAVGAIQREVDAFDPASLTGLTTGAAAVRAAALGLAGQLSVENPRRLRLQAAAPRLEATASLGDLAANRARYQDVLRAMSGLADQLRRTGVSEADVAVAQLRQAVAPLAPLGEQAQRLLGFLGLGGAVSSLGSVLRAVLQVASPARLSALFTRLLAALRDRLQTLADQILAPVREALDDLTRLLSLLDLEPVIDAIDGVFQEVRTQVLAYSPAVLLHDQLTAFATLQQTLAGFDPLAALLEVLDALRDTAARVVGKLSAEKLLESPLAIYDAIVDAIRPLDVSTLLAPVLDALDSIARQVDEGLDATVAAFKHLQEALPPPGGGSSVSVSVVVV